MMSARREFPLPMPCNASSVWVSWLSDGCQLSLEFSMAMAMAIARAGGGGGGRVAMASSLPKRLRDAALRCCWDEASEESEAAARREFVEILSSPLYDVELRRASATKWLAQCEQVLQQAVELLDPSASSGLDLCE